MREVHWVQHPSCLRGCRQISKISAFVGNSRIAGGVEEGSIFMPSLPTLSLLQKLLIFYNIICIAFVLIRQRCQHGALGSTR